MCRLCIFVLVVLTAYWVIENANASKHKAAWSKPAVVNCFIVTFNDEGNNDDDDDDDVVDIEATNNCWVNLLTSANVGIIYNFCKGKLKIPYIKR